MDAPLLAGRDHARKRAAAANISPNQQPVKQEQAQELGPLHDLLSSPPQPEPKRLSPFPRALIKRTIISAYCHGLIGVEVTQKLINKFGLESA